MANERDDKLSANGYRDEKLPIKKVEMLELTEVNAAYENDEDDDFEISPLIERSSRSKGGKKGLKDDDDHDGSGKGGQKWGKYLAHSLKELFFGTKINILLPFVPISIIAVQLKVDEMWIFLFALLGIAPLAERLGFVTEQIAMYTGPTMGGLLNATFGNATELIISLFALREGLLRVVQLSLLGSILSNMLLVLGCAFFFGGLRFKHQKFNKTGAMVNSGLLLMAVFGLTSPAVLQSTHTERHERSSELALSRFSSCVMLVAYAAYLYFQLKSHSHLYEEEGEGNDDNDEEEILGFWGAVVWLGIITVYISILSEYLVTAIEDAAADWNVPISFLSVIILPIVGNAAEHASAVIFAMRNKLDISLGVAIGSSTQISMFVIPFCVVVAWVFNIDMDLNFHIFETATLFITVLVVSVILQEGESNYFKGVMLILSYLIASAAFFVHEDSSEVESVASAAAAVARAISPAAAPATALP
eukprot:TRINITY_DN4016_c0_g1_i1.p1 TRINITY_DN4016_c0_g1~~TRINITY_DN4016_c0_g1_i1.p1  ORF type:complete len:476 (-),score=139.71 TRINITY_DN4016_c0_g1_i1:78-1505(-)